MDWGFYLGWVRTKSLNAIIIIIINMERALLSFAVHCIGLLILAQYRGSPITVPSHHCSQPCPATLPRAQHGWSGSHFPSCWRIKSKQQPQKICRHWAQVGVITIFCFLQCKKLCMHMYKHVHISFRIPIKKIELYRDIMTYYLTYTLK